MLIDFKEREGERERHRCEKETSIGCLSYVPQPGTEPATQARALTGNRTLDLLVADNAPDSGATQQGLISGPQHRTSQCVHAALPPTRVGMWLGTSVRARRVKSRKELASDASAGFLSLEDPPGAERAHPAWHPWGVQLTV